MCCDFFADVEPVGARGADRRGHASAASRRCPASPNRCAAPSLVALRGCYCGDPADGRALLDQARAALGPAAVDTFARCRPPALATVSMDPVDPSGAASHSELLARAHAATPSTRWSSLAGPDSRSPLVMLEVRQLGGALAGPADALSPMAHTEAGFSLNAIGITPTPEQAAAVRAHLGKVAATMRPLRHR